MDWDLIAPMIVAVVLIVTVGTVTLLRPLAARLGKLLDAMAEDRSEPTLKKEVVRIREMLETVSDRLELIEERQDFTEALLGRSNREGRELPAGPEEESAPSRNA